MGEGASYDIAAPSAASLIESLRAFSYDLSTSLADLVDNSITARATTVWVDFYWDGERSAISVTDDGVGMSEATLVQAMRPGSQSPLRQRDPRDLGRFGLGLKTASFSQARQLSVFSKELGCDVAVRCWDLDHVARIDDWQLLRNAPRSAGRYAKRLTDIASGTAVVWTNMDRITKGTKTDSDEDQRRFLEAAVAVGEHLSIVFHRLLKPSGSLRLLLNGNELQGWDPFLHGNPATQLFPSTVLRIGRAAVEVTPYVLPHQSRLSKESHRTAGGRHGWNAHQGFYVYRNKRLLVPGSWLGLGWTKEEHYKLARIRVDIDNTADAEWDINVTKSRAVPPPQIRGELKKIGAHTRGAAKRVYTFRGAKLAPKLGEPMAFLWELVARRGKKHYRLDRNHPLIKGVVSDLRDGKRFRSLLSLIEETIPVANIAVTHAEEPQAMGDPFSTATPKQIVEVVRSTFEALLEQGHSISEAAERLSSMWPFNQHNDIVLSVAEEISSE